jgi:T4 RnlA family RNA ligase
MTKVSLELYQNLMKLCEPVKSMFYYVDHKFGDKTYRVFSYHFATYTEWQQPDALECRGIMFEVNALGEPVRVASRPMEKFFNVNENPFTQNLDFRRVKSWSNKMDGSLISTFLHEGQLHLKSKTSIRSDQVVEASAWLSRPENRPFKSMLQWITQTGFTVNMEWTSPTNRIVVGYDKSNLTVLNIRHNESGQYFEKGEAAKHFGLGILDHWCAEETVPEYLLENHQAVLNYVGSMVGVEGFVLTFHGGLRAKLKTEWYCRLHRTKETVSSSKRLYEALVSGQYDDLMSLWHEDETMKNRILDMHSKIGNIFLGLTLVNDYYNNNKHLDRKTYAIKAQKEIPVLFHMAMELYKGNEADYKTHMLKNIELYLPRCKMNDLEMQAED